MNGEITQTSVLAGRSVSPSTITDLRAVQTGADDNFLHQGANSDMTEHTSQCADSLYIPGYHQLHTWTQGQVSVTDSLTDQHTNQWRMCFCKELIYCSII